MKRHVSVSNEILTTAKKWWRKRANFIDALSTGRTPESTAKDYIQRDDAKWAECAGKWRDITLQITSLEEQEQELRKQLIFLSGESNSRGSGISLCEIKRKGNVDYAAIPELRGVNLEQYRKPTTCSWRITAK